MATYADLQIAKAEAVGDEAEAEFWRRVKADVDRAPALGPAQKQLLRTLLLTPAPSASSPAA